MTLSFGERRSLMTLPSGRAHSGAGGGGGQSVARAPGTPHTACLCHGALRPALTEHLLCARDKGVSSADPGPGLRGEVCPACVRSAEKNVGVRAGVLRGGLCVVLNSVVKGLPQEACVSTGIGNINTYDNRIVHSSSVTIFFIDLLIFVINYPSRSWR